MSGKLDRQVVVVATVGEETVLQIDHTSGIDRTVCLRREVPTRRRLVAMWTDWNVQVGSPLPNTRHPVGSPRPRENSTAAGPETAVDETAEQPAAKARPGGPGDDRPDGGLSE